MADEKRVNELLDELLEGRSPEEVVGEGGLLSHLTKRLMERRSRVSSPITWDTQSTRPRAEIAAARAMGIPGSGPRPAPMRSS